MTPTILLTNDDGPPSDESPFIYSFTQTLIENFLGNDPKRLKVLIPDSQKSWIGKAYLIKERIRVKRFDPTKGEVGKLSNGQSEVEGSDYEDRCWYVANGTPASCSNIGLFNLFPGKIDLVISGPNFGRNTSRAFSLSSGTLGAALDAALSDHPSIALSYGIHQRPISDSIVSAAHSISIKIIQILWATGFKKTSKSSDKDDDSPDLYSINIPLVPAIIESEPKVVWTFESPTRYGRLFLPDDERPDRSSTPTKPAEIDERSKDLQAQAPSLLRNRSDHADGGDGLTGRGSELEFLFKPDISALIDPNSSHHPVGSDAWAHNRGYCSVTPLKASFRNVNPPTIASQNSFQNITPADRIRFWNL
ncbi:survival protein sure-like phosphatase/nucleotidase [Phakopsora pachyrhizi]|uniref:Survival protein sure-like phosphatase/nucleotidase n=1 Tax=Phakopsora pachyrhizi TaxID=170000 RepID=A0AAV0AU21_PHAPC|nr:survival protein sure-like phosphatase/nucleotidase [Phakopsora pachyrhizi]KAI8450586.1 survival protein sure-like phosphatase/nucleotidase [Phakopsora pachyrhizi]CAH7671787.1 survival protein sure-like phosphatase/nucleotidase [Phakopsora pachyrhizi]